MLFESGPVGAAKAGGESASPESRPEFFVPAEGTSGWWCWGGERWQLLRPANPLLRGLARYLDAVLAAPPLAILVALAGGPNPFVGAACLAAVCLVEATLLHRWGRTPGKALLGYSVITTTGGHLSWWQGLARSALVWSALLAISIDGSPAFVMVILTVLVGGPTLVRRDHRGLHDLVVGSLVTKPADHKASGWTVAFFVVLSIVAVVGLSVVIFAVIFLHAMVGS